MGPVDAWWARWWWSLLAVALGAALLLVSVGVGAARDEVIAARLDASSAAARILVTSVLVREVTASELAAPFPADATRALDAMLRAEVFVDPSVAQVRIWTGDAVVLFSAGAAGEVAAPQDVERPIDDALAGIVVSRATTESVPARAGLDPLPTEIWETWLPLRTADRPTPQAAIEIDQYRGVIVAGAGAGAARLGTALRVLAVLSFVAAIVLAVATARRRRPPSGPAATDASAAPDAGEHSLALIEVAHERDVSIARAIEAEDRERLANDRLAALSPLERRLEVAERRALDAERRLEEITERLAAERAEADEPTDRGDATGGDGSDAGPPDPSEAAARRAAELRARLGRRSNEKKRDP